MSANPQERPFPSSQESVGSPQIQFDDWYATCFLKMFTELIHEYWIIGNMILTESPTKTIKILVLDNNHGSLNITSSLFFN